MEAGWRGAELWSALFTRTHDPSSVIKLKFDLNVGPILGGQEYCIPCTYSSHRLARMHRLHWWKKIERVLKLQTELQRWLYHDILTVEIGENIESWPKGVSQERRGRKKSECTSVT